MGKIFRRGLIALAPVAISIAILIWLLGTLEDIFREPIIWAIGEQYYFPGMGLLVAFVFIFLIGIIVNNYLIQKVSGWADKLFKRIPLFKTLYNSVGDMMAYFKPTDPTKKGKMVVVEIDSIRFLAIMTRENLGDLPDPIGGEDRVAVFIPFSYQIGGFTASVPRSQVKPVDLSVEEGMRFVVTAGIAVNKPKEERV